MLFKESGLVNCPIIPEIEFIKINIEAVVTICVGFPTLNKKRIGLKKIPPPIPTTPETKPRTPPIKKDINFGIFL